MTPDEIISAGYPDDLLDAQTPVRTEAGYILRSPDVDVAYETLRSLAGDKFSLRLAVRDGDRVVPVFSRFYEDSPAGIACMLTFIANLDINHFLCYNN
jgi:hypothetical protein